MAEPVGGAPSVGRPVRLSDRALIETALPSGIASPSEYCFANIYLFRDRHAYRLHDTPVPHLNGVTYDGARHALPLVPIDERVFAQLAPGPADCIYPLPAAVAEMPIEPGWRWQNVDADSDYIYNGEAMAQMAFSDQRRAEAEAFAERCKPVLLPWEEGVAADAQAVLDGWLADTGRGPDEADYRECSEAISLSGQLGLTGGIVKDETGEASAFLLATRCADDTLVVHFAKGRRAAVGAYPWMFAQLARRNSARYLNFEQDLGNPGLAQSKRAYRPVECHKKMRLVFSPSSD